MIDSLVKKFFKNPGIPGARQKYGMAAGGVGIFVNVLLFAAKLAVGISSGAVSIVADAFNNLSDAGTSVVMLLGFHFSARPADGRHPFGYGRTEYLAGLAVSAAILLAGAELARESVNALLHPAPMDVDHVTLTVLACSTVAKLLLASFYKASGNAIGSSAILAASTDSLADAAATSVVFFSILAYKNFAVNLDGAAGIIVAGFILYGGWSAMRDTARPLMGDAPDPEMMGDIRKSAMAEPDVIGVHDLIVHDYGPGRRFVSMDVEMPASMTLIEAHERIDRLEKKLMAKFPARVTLHIDPVVTDDPETDRLFVLSSRILASIDESLSLHDFHTVPYKGGRKIVFDVKLPEYFAGSDRELKKEFLRRLMDVRPMDRAEIRIDRHYC